MKKFLVLISAIMFLSCTELAFKVLDSDISISNLSLSNLTPSQLESLDLNIDVINSGSSNSGFLQVFAYLKDDINEWGLFKKKRQIKSLKFNESSLYTYTVVIPVDVISTVDLIVEIYENGFLVSSSIEKLDVSELTAFNNPPPLRNNAQILQGDKGYQSNITVSEKNWFYIIISPYTTIDFLFDGSLGDLTVSLYKGNSTTIEKSMTDDNFSKIISVENNSPSDLTIYLEISSSIIQEYWMICNKK